MHKSLSVSKGVILLSLFVASCKQVSAPVAPVKKSQTAIIPQIHKPAQKPDTDAVVLLEQKFPQYKNGKVEKIHDKKNHLISISVTGKNHDLATLVGSTTNAKNKKLESSKVTYALITDNHGNVMQEFEISKKSDGFVIKKIPTPNEIEDETHKVVLKAQDYQSALLSLKR